MKMCNNRKEGRSMLQPSSIVFVVFNTLPQGAARNLTKNPLL
ncbi:hypothetical protein [Rubritalea tangerina]